MLPSESPLNCADRSLPDTIFGSNSGLRTGVASDGAYLFVGEFGEGLMDTARLSVPALSHHVGIVVGVGSDEQVREFATGGNVTSMADQRAFGEWTIGINIGGTVNEPESAIPPHAAVTVLDCASLPNSAAGDAIADGVEVDLLCEGNPAWGVLSGHEPMILLQ